jgi:hypothetical protein
MLHFVRVTRPFSCIDALGEMRSRSRTAMPAIPWLPCISQRKVRAGRRKQRLPPLRVLLMLIPSCSYLSGERGCGMLCRTESSLPVTDDLPWSRRLWMRHFARTPLSVARARSFWECCATACGLQETFLLPQIAGQPTPLLCIIVDDSIGVLAELEEPEMVLDSWRCKISGQMLSSRRDLRASFSTPTTRHSHYTVRSTEYTSCV